MAAPARRLVAQEYREDRLELDHREVRADTAVPTGAERDPRPAVDEILFRGSAYRLGSEGVRLGEVLAEPVRDRRRSADELARGDPVASNSTSRLAMRSSRMSGGCSRSASLIADSSTGISRSAWKLTGARRRTARPARRTSAKTSGWRSSSMRVQAAVPDVVWWPANIVEMNSPVISSAENGVCRRVRDRHQNVQQVPVGPRRVTGSAMMPSTRRTSSARAASLRRKLSIGASGPRTRADRCPVPGRGRAPRTARRAGHGTSCRSGRPRTCRSSARRTTPAGRSPPLSPPRRRALDFGGDRFGVPAQESPRSAWLCSISLRRSGGASNTTPSPKIGFMNGYASAWSRSSSGARKKYSLAAAPGSSTTPLFPQPELADVPALPYPAHEADRVSAQLVQVIVRDRTSPPDTFGGSLQRRSLLIAFRPPCRSSRPGRLRLHLDVARRDDPRGIDDDVRDRRAPRAPGRRKLSCARARRTAPTPRTVGASFVGSQSAAHLGRRRSGTNDRRPYARPLELHLHDPREALDAPLRRDGRPPSPDAAPSNAVRRDEDEVAAVALDHPRRDERRRAAARRAGSPAPAARTRPAACRRRDRAA